MRMQAAVRLSRSLTMKARTQVATASPIFPNRKIEELTEIAATIAHPITIAESTNPDTAIRGITVAITTTVKTATTATIVKEHTTAVISATISTDTTTIILIITTAISLTPVSNRVVPTLTVIHAKTDGTNNVTISATRTSATTVTAMRPVSMPNLKTMKKLHTESLPTSLTHILRTTGPTAMEVMVSIATGALIPPAQNTIRKSEWIIRKSFTTPMNLYV